MEKLIAYVVVIAFAYLLTVFVALGWNPIDWPDVPRLIFAATVGWVTLKAVADE